MVRTFVTADKVTLALSLRDDERGEHEQVDATAEHPFWLEGRGWVGAGSLQVGQRVLRADGRWLRVERVEAKAGRTTVYNLEVDDWHTYVVGSLGAWVHNTCNPAGTAKAIAEHLVNAHRGSVTKSLADISKMKLGQDKAIEVLQQMYQASGRGTAGTQTLADGAKALLLRRLGTDQSILVIAKDGAVRAAKATIELTGDLKNPLRAVDIVF